LVQKGWNVAEGNPSQAQGLFRQALDLEPNNDEAAYGFGYTLLLQDRTADATPWLCKVRNSRIAEVRQDASGMILSRQLQCQ
jgi:Flp pilus assembly protein TadD